MTLVGSMNTTEINGAESPVFDLKLIAEVNLPTRWANFRMLGFEGSRAASALGPARQETALALVLGDVRVPNPLVRIHSQCATGDVFHSLRCDCHDQLHLALQAIADEGSGILLYEHQEGRGIGLMEKLRAYALQDQGLDTIAANLQLGHAVDHRDYRLVVGILQFLKVSSLRLMTNNPEKINAVLEAGINVTSRVAADVAQTPHSAHYMAVKRERLGHLSGTQGVDAVARGLVPTVGHADAGGVGWDYSAASIDSGS